MRILEHSIALATAAPIEIVDVTGRVRDWLATTGVTDGLLTLVTLHTTARLNVNEREERLQRDMVTFLERLVPRDGDYLHNLDTVDGRDNAHSHLLGLFMSSSVTIPVAEGKPVLGEWQSIFFVELDGPRQRRTVELQLLGA